MLFRAICCARSLRLDGLLDYTTFGAFWLEHGAATWVYVLMDTRIPYCVHLIAYSTNGFSILYPPGVALPCA